MPLLFYGQAPLVRWYNTDFSPTLSENHMTASNIKPSPNVTLTNTSWGSENVFYDSANWSSAPTLDESKYIEFSLSADPGYKILLDRFYFNVRSQGGSSEKLQIRFSKKSDFSESHILLSETILNQSYNAYQPAFPIGYEVAPNETVYVRIYVYNSYNHMHIQHNNSGGIAPYLTGSVMLETPVVASAFDDTAGTYKNTPVTFNVLQNDFYAYTSPITGVNIYHVPEHGMVTTDINGNMTYTPNSGFTGYDAFYYTLTNDVGTSSPAKVELQVIDGTEKVLARWHTDNGKGDAYSPEIVAEDISTSGGITTSNDVLWMAGKADKVYKFSGMPSVSDLNGTIDLTKYIQLELGTEQASSVNALLKSLKMEYNANGTGKLTIKYSKDPLFRSGISTLLPETSFANTAYNSWYTVNLSFGGDAFLYPGEKLYVRLYVYNISYQTAPFYIRYGNLQDAVTAFGPSIKGMVSSFIGPACTETVVWDGQWSSTPKFYKKAILKADYDTKINGSFEACSLSIENGSVLSIRSEQYVRVVKGLNVDSNGKIEIESDGNFVQDEDDAVNSGDGISNFSVKRISAMKRLDYTYWSSPVKDQQLKAFSPNTVSNRFYEYHENDDLFYSVNWLTNFSAAKGYAVRAPNNFTTENQDFTGIFKGVPHNGKITFPVSYTPVNSSSPSTHAVAGYNLIGNPYPSNMNFEEFYKNNSEVINEVAYFWTNINDYVGQQGSNYNGNNYAILNGTGGIPATNLKSAPNQVLVKIPTPIIKTGQAFVVKVKPGNNGKELVYNNSIRTNSTSGSFFGKMAQNKDRYWVELLTPDNIRNTILIGYLQEATNEFDVDYDAPLYVKASDAFYSIVDDNLLGIQGRAYPFDVEDKIKLGAQFYKPGNYTIQLGDREGIFMEGRSIYLKDKNLGTIVDLSTSPYTFYSEAGDFMERFEISYVSGATLGVIDNKKDDIVVYRSGEEFIVKSYERNIKQIQVIEMSGRVLTDIKEFGKIVRISASDLPNSSYILKISTEDGIRIRKIIK